MGLSRKTKLAILFIGLVIMGFIVDSLYYSPLRKFWETAALTAGFICYFIPTIVAFIRKHRNRVPVGLTNFFFGWTIVGWIVSFIWAFSSNVEPEKSKDNENSIN